MEMALILFNKLLSMFLMIAVGWLFVRSGILKSQESRALSLLSLYVVCPVAIMNAFEVEPTSEVISGLLLAVFFAVLTHVVFIAGVKLLQRPLKLNEIDRASIIYSNAGMIAIPVVNAILGPEWVIYTCAYNAVQLCLLWTHCRILISGESRIEPKKIIFNPNIIAIIVGMFILFTGFRFPGPISNAIDDIAGMIGPVGMMITGMIIGGVPMKKLLSMKRVWLIVLLRLFVAPGIMAFIAKYSGLISLVPNGETVLLISLLSVAGPSGATVMQMTQIYRGHELSEYAGAI
ncbi:MAG: AEC family transporter, partial [Oscillospiraceae bacterium]|nr:AEC family transporter [Oscillospiraceae bacterium]